MNKTIGIRLHNLELYNWGTFNNEVWRFNPEGNTSLLTGDSGSGKSTIVDALSTLLIPPRKLAYNKAADASAKERTAKSYVLGYYGRKYANEGRGKPEKLRDENNYSVILATFKDEVLNNTTSLAIFFWFKGNESEPSKLYVVSKKELFISEDFSKFGSDIKTLRSRLRQKEAKIFDAFSNYSEYYRKCLGGISEQAIDLFQQTISMKKVEALNEFVRDSMLEKDDIQGDIEELLKHYANLNSAYEAVIKAKTQIEKLTPINEKGQEYLATNKYVNLLNTTINRNEIWFAGKYKTILEQQISELTHKKEVISYKLNLENEKISEIKNEIQIIENDINQNGGNELLNLDQQIKNYKKELHTKQNELIKYDKYANILGLKSGVNLDDYNSNKFNLPRIQKELENKNSKLQNSLVEITIEKKNYIKKNEEAQKELESLSKRTSNIPYQLVELRENLCYDLKIDTREIPFAGELIEVKESEIRWEGAIERLVHSFAISILVPNKHYQNVVQWVNQKNLGIKLVYFKVEEDTRKKIFTFDENNTVASKLIIKKDNIFSQWLNNEINQRFPHICCDSLDDFRRQIKAITIHGQIRSGQRHEKDDRHNINNRMRYVLGFSNRKKMEILKSNISEISKEILRLTSQYEDITNDRKKQDILLQATAILLDFNTHETIDTLTVKKAIAEKEARISEINQSNNILSNLKAQKIKKETELNKAEDVQNSLTLDKSYIETNINILNEKRADNIKKLSEATENDKEIFTFLEQDYKNYLAKQQLSLIYSEKYEKEYNKNLSNRLSQLQKKISTLKAEIEKSMANFKHEYPIETNEMTDEVESLKEYSNILDKLLYDNLPKFQREFKSELQGKITKHISLFHAKLYTNSKKIAERIEEINQSLKNIPYNIGRYITLNCEDTVESDIRNFKAHLKSCTEGMTSIDDELIEQKFKQIKAIIGKFKGQPNSLEADRRWTNKVTDVRNWFVFSATERYLENDEEYEHYSDSDGKSGGQKEKLAYTILAASLAYNYKLNKKDNHGSSFRLVVIDEAFLKSSDESAKFGLSLFENMHFQLLVVTPLLKISTIEPFISHVGFVSHNDITHISQLRNIPIEIYRKNRKLWEEKNLEKMD